MAGAGENSHENGLDSDLLQLLGAQFFQMNPVRRIRWKGQMINYDNIGPKEQKKVLQATVLHPLCQKYAPSLSYRRAFMKQLLQRLEELDAEICDEIYETYTDLLQQRDTEDDDMLCYKTYFLSYSSFLPQPNHERVTLQESVHLISQGTTGLSTWQAALHLAEWAIEKCRIFENRKVLELGSGLGLTGLTICKHCQIKSFTFSDCHPQVLYLLMRNIELNLTKADILHKGLPVIPQSDKTKITQEKKMLKSICQHLSVNSENVSDSSSDIMEISYNSMVSSTETVEEEEGEDSSRTDCDIFTPNMEIWNTTESKNIHQLKNDERVKMMKFDWESDSKHALEFIDPDVIIAADVVYDKTIIPALVSVLGKLLSRMTEDGQRPVAYIASTVRNEDTRDNFLIVLGNEGLAYSVVEPPTEKLFYYDDIIPVEILEIYYP